jgi:hypothetical protein
MVICSDNTTYNLVCAGGGAASRCPDGLPEPCEPGRTKAECSCAIWGWESPGIMGCGVARADGKKLLQDIVTGICFTK